MTGQTQPHYGVLRRAAPATEVERCVELVRLAGYATLASAVESSRVAAAFDRALDKMHACFGRDRLAALNEHNGIRAPLALDPVFLELAADPGVLAVCRALMGDYIVLNQQNGVRNPPNGEPYNQGAFHRDLPYQHFTSSRPLAVSALYCIDDFKLENGATVVVPASHKSEDYPSEDAIRTLEVTVTAPAGSFIVMDSMLYHRGGVNGSPAARRGVNHVYSIPILRQQIDLPALLGPEGAAQDPALRKLLGYELDVPRDVDAFLAARRKG